MSRTLPRIRGPEVGHGLGVEPREWLFDGGSEIDGHRAASTKAENRGRPESAGWSRRALPVEHVVFGVRHETHDRTTLIAEPGDIGHRAVGVRGIDAFGRLMCRCRARASRLVTKGDLAPIVECRDDRVVGHCHSPLPVGDRTADHGAGDG